MREYVLQFFKPFSTTTELIRRQCKCLKLMCGNTRPKLLEVSHGKTSQHSKGLYSYHVKYAHTVNVHTTVALPQRHTKAEPDDDVGRRKRRLTKTEVNEDGDIRRRRQTHSGAEQSGSSLLSDVYPRVTKTEADEEEDTRTLGSSKEAVPFQLTTTQQ